jgi:hypothetical protein
LFAFITKQEKSDILKMSLFSRIKDRALNQKPTRSFKALGSNPFSIIGAKEEYDIFQD